MCEKRKREEDIDVELDRYSKTLRLNIEEIRKVLRQTEAHEESIASQRNLFKRKRCEVENLQKIQDVKSKEIERERANLEKLKESMFRLSEDSADKVKLNVGGTIFETTQLTLKRDPQSMLAVYASGNWSPKEDGTHFIDRDAQLFPYVLEYLRDGQITRTVPEELESAVRQEFVYFGLSDYFYQKGIAELELCGSWTLSRDATKNLMKQAADMGHKAALGMCYHGGNGYERDKTKSAELLRQASDAGDSFATFYLGKAYIHGSGVDKDKERAAELYAQAVEMGNSRAMDNLGRCYERGAGVEKDEKRAIELYRQGADMGNPVCMGSLARCYTGCMGVEKDDTQAFKLYTQAVELGCIAAIHKLSTYYRDGCEVRKDQKRAVELCRKGVERNVTASMVYLGICYEKGNGVCQDVNKAVELYRKAALMRSPRGMYHLSRCYKFGNGVALDRILEKRWLRKAAKKGSSIARHRLGLCINCGATPGTCLPGVCPSWVAVL